MRTPQRSSYVAVDARNGCPGSVSTAREHGADLDAVPIAKGTASGAFFASAEPIHASERPAERCGRVQRRKLSLVDGGVGCSRCNSTPGQRCL